MKGEGGLSRVSDENFCLTVSKSFVGDPSVLCSRKFLKAKKFMVKRGGGWSITIFCRRFFVSHCQKVSKGIPSVLCSRKFLVAKKFMDNRGWRRITLFRRKFFASQC